MIGRSFSGCKPFELISSVFPLGYKTSQISIKSLRRVGSPPVMFRLSKPPGNFDKISGVTSSLGSVGFCQI